MGHSVGYLWQCKKVLAPVISSRKQVAGDIDMALKCSSLILLLAASTNAGPLYYQNGPNVLGHPFFYQPQEPVQSQYMQQFYSQQGGPYRPQGPYQGQQMLYSQPQPIPYQSQQPQQYNPVQPVQSVDEPEVIPEPEPEAKDIALE